jgi:hypothetical protein
MSADQAGIFREFVSNGGVLYATGLSSMSVPGEGEERYLLEDVLGVRYLGTLGEHTTYLSATDKELNDTIWPQENISFSGSMMKAQAASGANVLATVTLPFVDPDAGTALNTRFAQIWSNPPDTQPGRDPGIVMNSFGKGKTIWIAAPLESQASAVNARIFSLLLKRVLSPPYHFEVDTDHEVEVTLFHQENHHRLLLGMLNLQAQLPTKPVAATVRVQVPRGYRARRVALLPEEKELAFSPAGSYIAFHIPAFNLVSMVMVDYV